MSLAKVETWTVNEILHYLLESSAKSVFLGCAILYQSIENMKQRWWSVIFILISTLNSVLQISKIVGQWNSVESKKVELPFNTIMETR